jgi:hypothetical protein
MPLLRIAARAGALIVLALPPAAHAQNNITIYRCVDASGAITLQNDVPCPKGSQQTVRRIGVLPTLPAPPAALVKAPAAPPAPQPAPPLPVPAAAAPRTAPPALFQCRTWDERDYLGDTAEPPSTCAPVQSVGIDGSTELGAGSTCEMRQDTCVAVPAEQLCASWKKRVDEAEFRWKFGGGRDDERKAEFDRLSKTYRESTCLGG